LTGARAGVLFEDFFFAKSTALANLSLITNHDWSVATGRTRISITVMFP